MKKIYFITLLLLFVTNNLYAKNKIFISVIINNIPITNIDILEEANYLVALNPNIKNLSKKEIISIAKDSLIKEKIKEQELKKHFDLKKENKLVENILKTIYTNLKLNNRQELVNYLFQFDIGIKSLIYKINIEARWNELIYKKYSKKFEIDYEKIKKNINSQNNELIDIYLLSEILFNVENKSDLEKFYNKIKSNIERNNFSSAAKIYSLSNTANSGGKVGWISKKNLSDNIKKQIENLKINQISKPIGVPGGYLILKIEDKKKEKTKVKDFKKEFDRLSDIERNRKLNQFSIIHFSKVKKNIEIIYEP